MILRGPLSGRRRVLLVILLLVLAWLAYAWFAGMAITRGVEMRDMDWDGDGTVSRTELAQAFYAVVVEESQQGSRHCRTFKWRRSGEQIRVDCRTVFGEQAADKR
ncbi:EF-hand domain-containing protein [Stenotrophomonas sp. MMGLT7]|uniref:EF-hand domain-containing protein n=1 Tax=Stenotrophomonas sp. MMGLT7 TaxID=2901227 RepID=UPI001E51E106|nr:EF-hand domain-containing protein [Stenotrophomonas sp. MMGLT7]MCD7098652.1 EF-hand domain-containing protein [Stenotrophomonas sp. MMGLT7]